MTAAKNPSKPRYPTDAIKREDLFNNVDGLLYQAKVFVKNKVYFNKEDAVD